MLQTNIVQSRERANDWPEELKHILSALVDLAERMLASKESKLALNEVLTPEELATRLKIAASTIEELARKGKLPGAFRVGKHWRFDVDLLRAQLAVQESAPLDNS
jgi:excisionase family DNA binding protein